MTACASIAESGMLHTEKIQSTVQKNAKTSRSGLEKASNATRTQNRFTKSVLFVGMHLTLLGILALLAQAIARENTIKYFAEENRRKSQRLALCAELCLCRDGKSKLFAAIIAGKNTEKRKAVSMPERTKSKI